MERNRVTETREAMPKRYTIVSFIGEPPQSFNKSRWPLHVTLIPPFVSSVTPHELHETMQEICQKYKAIGIEGGERKHFGPQEDIPVTQLKNIDALQVFHNDLNEACKQKISFPETKYIFTPHVTDNSETMLGVGEKQQLTTLSLVEIDGEKRTVLFNTDINQTD